MRKKVNISYYLPYDIHIVKALMALPVPLLTFDNHEVYFNKNKRHETIYEHIAKKKHHLHVVDIERIPVILKDQRTLRPDRNGTLFRVYVGKRGKKNEKPPYLKIVTEMNIDNKETVISIYPDKN